MRGGAIGVAGWALAFPWLMFITEFSTVRIQEPFVLYRAYLWFPVFSVIVPLAISHFSLRAASVSVVVIVCAFVPLSWNRLTSLSESLLAWNDAAKLLVRGDEPGAGRIYYNRARALSAKGRKEEALRDMDRVVVLHPRLAPTHVSRGKLLFDLKRYNEALDELNIAIDLDAGQGGYYFARAAILRRLGRDRGALWDIRKSCELGNIIACATGGQKDKARK
jgi:tetratricopeptide (TPR) repeat protein